MQHHYQVIVGNKSASQIILDKTQLLPDTYTLYARGEAGMEGRVGDALRIEQPIGLPCEADWSGITLNIRADVTKHLCPKRRRVFHKAGNQGQTSH